MITSHLDKNNLHHAYLIEGARDEVVPEIIGFLKSIGVSVVGNPDFINITIDNFKKEEALDLRAMSSNKGFTAGKTIFIISVNTFSLDAENILLKMFEEPTENTHFFLVVPDINILLKTLVSRFYLIKTESSLDLKEAEKFISMPLVSRINFIKELLTEGEEEGNEIIALPARNATHSVAGGDSTRAKALKFLNALETVLHRNLSRVHLDKFEHIFKVREFLRMPGSSTKSLMESVALITPIY